MRRSLVLIFAFTFFLSSVPASFGYKILYAEQYYRLFHAHYYQYPERIAENVAYLQQALASDFANPLYALAAIPDTKHWERYRYLFYMHVNLKLVEQHLVWGGKYQKMAAYFFNAPWKEDNLESLNRAEDLFKYALSYWEEAKKWSAKAAPLKYHLEEIQFWEDENLRIETKDLNYEDIINEHLARIERVRKDFQAMDEKTY